MLASASFLVVIVRLPEFIKAFTFLKLSIVNFLTIGSGLDDLIATPSSFPNKLLNIPFIKNKSLNLSLEVVSGCSGLFRLFLPDIYL